MQVVFSLANFLCDSRAAFAGQKKCVVLFIKQDDRSGNVLSFVFWSHCVGSTWHLGFTVSWPPSVVNAHLTLTSDSNQRLLKCRISKAGCLPSLTIVPRKHYLFLKKCCCCRAEIAWGMKGRESSRQIALLPSQRFCVISALVDHDWLFVCTAWITEELVWLWRFKVSHKPFWYANFSKVRARKNPSLCGVASHNGKIIPYW